jgi:hypothetical protein
MENPLPNPNMEKAEVRDHLGVNPIAHSYYLYKLTAGYLQSYQRLH